MGKEKVIVLPSGAWLKKQTAIDMGIIKSDIGMLEKGEYIEYGGKRYYNEDVEYIDGSIHIEREEFKLNEGLGDLADATICSISVNGEKYLDSGMWQKPKKERLPRKLKKRLKKVNNR